jgi:hypothetical protein
MSTFCSSTGFKSLENVDTSLSSLTSIDVGNSFTNALLKFTQCVELISIHFDLFSKKG